MKSASLFLLPVLSFILFSCSSSSKRLSTYYFDPVNGNDSNPGTAITHPCKSLSRIKSLPLQPGDSILLKAGAVFNESLYISAKGDRNQPIVVGKYGIGERPHIKGDASRLQSVHVFNSEYIVVRDLEISNKGDTAVNGLNGLLVELLNYGTARDITLDNLYVHDVFGGLVKDKQGGNAIMIRNFHDEETDTVLSRFAGLTVQNCHVKDCQRNGIMMWGNWIRRLWFPSLGVVIRHNLIEGVPGDGIVPVGCEKPLVEYNVMRNCPAILPPTEACDGIWPWSCDDALIQFNIVSNHRSQVDGYGFDADWNCNNSIIQYNLSHDNDGGFLLICNSGGWEPEWSIGTNGSIIRYNISINDGLRNYSVPKSRRPFFSPVVHITGPVKNTLIENNLFYLPSKPSSLIDRTLVSLDDWTGYPDSTFFRKNFIYVEEPYAAFEFTSSTNNVFEGNQHIGPLITPDSGFASYRGSFNRQFWYHSADTNWNKMLQFVKDKTIVTAGQLKRVSDIIGL